MSDVEYESVEVLRLQPGDRLVVTVDDRLVTPEHVEHLRDAFRREFPRHRVIVLAGASLSVAREVGDGERQATPT